PPKCINCLHRFRGGRRAVSSVAAILLRRRITPANVAWRFFRRLAKATSIFLCPDRRRLKRANRVRSRRPTRGQIPRLQSSAEFLFLFLLHLFSSVSSMAPWSCFCLFLAFSLPRRTSSSCCNSCISPSISTIRNRILDRHKSFFVSPNLSFLSK